MSSLRMPVRRGALESHDCPSAGRASVATPVSVARALPVARTDLPCEEVDEVADSELLARGLISQAQGAPSAAMLDAEEGRSRAAKESQEGELQH